MARSTRPAIVQAAVDRLRQGDAGFTYERLASEAGVARQTLYSRFPDRAELIIAAVDELRAEVPELDDLTAAVQPRPDRPRAPSTPCSTCTWPSPLRC